MHTHILLCGALLFASVLGQDSPAVFSACCVDIGKLMQAFAGAQQQCTGEGAERQCYMQNNDDGSPSYLKAAGRGCEAVVPALASTEPDAILCEVCAFQKYAIITMVTSLDYVIGANALLRSLKTHLDPSVASKVNFIVLLIRDHVDMNADIRKVLHPDWSVCYVPLIRPPFEGAVAFERFKEQFTKLNIWRLEMYERIVYLDSDTITVGDISPLLTQPTKPFAAVRDYELGRIKDHFNMGVCSIRPSYDEFVRLNYLRATERNYRMDMAEQGLLNHVYKDDYDEFPFEYNGNLAAPIQDLAFWESQYPNLRIIHYTMVKPFARQNIIDSPDYYNIKREYERWLRYA